LECFLYFTASMLDILAKLTREFYPKNRAAISARYFTKIISFFTEIDRALDREFTEILDRNKDWILEVYDNRHTLAHSASSFVAFGNDGQVEFEKRKPTNVALFRVKEFQNLSQYLRETLANIYEFLDEYVERFRKVVPESEVTRALIKKDDLPET